MDRVFLAMPAGNGWPSHAADQCYFHTATDGRTFDVIRMSQPGSALGQTFNKLWAAALAAAEHHGATHFAMLHSDLAVGAWWLDTLYREQAATGADLLSAVVAIKDNKGLTSTAVGLDYDDWDYRRITATELQSLPETFGIDDVPATIREGGRNVLLANTGCWICDLRRPWWTETDAAGRLKFFFTQFDRVTRTREGRYRVEFLPEDWYFSRLLHRQGAKVLCTKKIKTAHGGTHWWTVDRPWGTLATDTEAVEFHEQRRLENDPPAVAGSRD